MEHFSTFSMLSKRRATSETGRRGLKAAPGVGAIHEARIRLDWLAGLNRGPDRPSERPGV
jgi:hypothetical protein